MRARQESARIHIAEVPHEGPTSKADCLNWIYQRMLLAEEQLGLRYELVVIHDAEDLIHPLSLDRIRCAASEGYGMIQVPVLALPTPLHELTHGLYCDDFAESQSKDLVSRVEMGGFLPGCGVGTGFSRKALEALAASNSNRLFDPQSLTEDYDNGVRVYLQGERQTFLPLETDRGAPVATREYFPRQMAAAIRQRSRWITGNSLQAWARYKWGRNLPRRWVQLYFFWRDRKSLWGAPMGLAANLVMLFTAVELNLTGRSWIEAAVADQPALALLLWINGVLLLERTLVRMVTVAGIYGWPFALLSPVRALWGNVVNSAASAKALAAWLRWRWFGIPLRWVKTDHAYPSREALASHRRKLGEILADNGYCAREIVEHALACQGEEKLGEYLVGTGLISAQDLCEALCLQQGLSMARLDHATLSVDLARSLPKRMQEEHSLVVVEARDGELLVAGASPPTPELMAQMQRFTRLRVRYCLTTPEDIAQARTTLQSRS